MNQPPQRRGNGFVLSRDLNAKLIPIASCKRLGRDTRKHPSVQIRKLAASLDRFGFVLPILVEFEGQSRCRLGIGPGRHAIGHYRSSGSHHHGLVRGRTAGAAACTQQAQ